MVKNLIYLFFFGQNLWFCPRNHPLEDFSKLNYSVPIYFRELYMIPYDAQFCLDIQMMIKYSDFYLIRAEMGTIERDMHDALRKMAEIYVIFPI